MSVGFILNCPSIMPTVDDTENFSTNLVFLKMTLSQSLLIFC